MTLVVKPIPHHPYHQKTDAELQFILKDALETARVFRGYDAEFKYLDQANDVATVTHYRRQVAAQGGK